MTAIRTKQLSETASKIIARAANRVWQEIGWDVLGGDETASIPRSHVIEVVLDAGRLDEELGVEVRAGRLLADELAQWKSMSYEAHQRFLRKNVFSFTRYGI